MQGERAERMESRGGRIGRRVITACALVLASMVAHAATRSASLGVSVVLFPNEKDVAACQNSASGPNVSVTCSSGGAGSQRTRFMLELYREGVKLGTVDGETAAGSVASWKVYRVADRDFLEIVVGW